MADPRKRATMLRNLEAQSGLTLAEWVARVRGCPDEGFMDRVRWLKGEHGLGHFQARLVVEAARDS